MKPVLISIQRPHTDNIKALIKNIEVRKGRPKQDTPFPCYIYETKAKGGCGKVIGEFVCDEVGEINKCVKALSNSLYGFETGSLEESCLTEKEIDDYLNGEKGYGWHISDLKIYDKPKELSEFKYKCDATKRVWGTPIGCRGCKYHDNGGCFRQITRPPQSWSYVEELEVKK